MKSIIPLNAHFAVAPALGAEDYAAAAALGYKAVLSNLPDGESPAHPSSGEAAGLAAAAGLQYRHLPASKSEVLGDRVVEGMIAAARELEGPILAHCASGLRSALAWGAAAARYHPVDDVLGVLDRAGFRMHALRDELTALHQPGAAAPPVPLRIEPPG